MPIWFYYFEIIGYLFDIMVLIQNPLKNLYYEKLI